MMRSVGRGAQLDDQIFVLGKVTVRIAREYSVEANPKYMRDVIAVLGLVATPNGKRTPTTESLVGLENDKRAAYKIPVGKLLHMCQERADIMYSVNETARKIICSTESDEMHMKRITRYLEECLVEILTFPQSVNVHTNSDWASQPLTCKSTSGGVVQRRNATLSARSRPAVSEPESRRSRTVCPDNKNCQRSGDETPDERTGTRSDSREPCRHSICEGMGIQTKN